MYQHGPADVLTLVTITLFYDLLLKKMNSLLDLLVTGSDRCAVVAAPEPHHLLEGGGWVTGSLALEVPSVVQRLVHLPVARLQPRWNWGVKHNQK